MSFPTEPSPYIDPLALASQELVRAVTRYGQDIQEISKANLNKGLDMLYAIDVTEAKGQKVVLESDINPKAEDDTP